MCSKVITVGLVNILYHTYFRDFFSFFFGKEEIKLFTYDMIIYAEIPSLQKS